LASLLLRQRDAERSESKAEDPIRGRFEGLLQEQVYTRAMSTIQSRLGAAVPDAITATSYLLAWVAPALLGPAWVRGLLAAVVIEFLVMHASAFYGFGMRQAGDSVRKSAIVLGVISFLYLIPMVGMAFFLQSITPVLTFIWLFTSRFAFMLVHPTTATAEARRMQMLWRVSIATFFAGIILTAKLPLPALGLTPDFVASLSMSGHPNPNAQPPQTTIAFGLLYFIVQACAKFYFAGADLPKQLTSEQRGAL
jgi:hypothetical protein